MMVEKMEKYDYIIDSSKSTDLINFLVSSPPKNRKICVIYLDSDSAIEKSLTIAKKTKDLSKRIIYQAYFRLYKRVLLGSRRELIWRYPAMAIFGGYKQRTEIKKRLIEEELTRISKKYSTKVVTIKKSEATPSSINEIMKEITGGNCDININPEFHNRNGNSNRFEIHNQLKDGTFRYIN